MACLMFFVGARGETGVSERERESQKKVVGKIKEKGKEETMNDEGKTLTPKRS